MSDETPTFPTTVQVRIFWEGVLFPYAEMLTVQDSPQQATCQMRVPESHALRVDELIGTMIHIFYKNSRIDAGDPGPSGPPDWPILFQGELAGQGESRNLQHRQKTLRFVGHTRHFKQAKLFFMDPQKRTGDNASETARAEDLAMFMGATKINLDTQGEAVAQQSRIWSQFEQAIKQFEGDEERSIGYQAVLLHLLRKAKENYPYLAYIDKKLNLTKRFAAYVDPDVKNLIQLKGLRKVVENRADSLDGEVSLMRLLNVANQILRYNWTKITQPTLRSKGKEGASVSQQTRDDARGAIETLQRALGRKIKGDTIGTSVGDISIPESTDGFMTFSADVFNRQLQARLDNGEEAGEVIQEFLDQRQWIPEPIDPNQAGSQDKQGGKQEDIAKLLEQEQNLLQARDELNEFAVLPNLEFAHPPKCNVILPQNVRGFGMQRNYLQEPTRLIGKMSFMKQNGQNPTHWYVAPFTQSFHRIEDGNVDQLQDAFAEFNQEIDKVQEEG